jgi:putative acetyltransferase
VSEGGTGVRIAPEPADQPEVLALIEALDAYQKPLYPPQSHHGIDAAELSRPNVIFAVARDADGTAVGCGAVVLRATGGELKRFYVSPGRRGRGIARALLEFLEHAAAARGCRRFMLETGYLQHEAIALYAACGYERCGPIEGYVEDANSVFMWKRNAG